MQPTDGVSGDALLTPASLAELPDFELGSATVSPSRRIVSGPSGEADVEPRVMQVLVILAQASGAVVTRETLFNRCWGGVYVGDDSLNRAVGAVRRLAAEVADGSFSIETIPRTGYRLVGTAPERVADAPDAAADAAPGARVSRRGAVAGAAALAAAGGIGIWSATRPRADPRFEALIERGQADLRQATPWTDQHSAGMFEQATALRPDLATGWGLLAYAKSIVADYAGPEESHAAIADSERAARKALAINPDEPNARISVIRLQGSTLDWATTEDRLVQVLASHPDNTRAMIELVALLQAAGRNRDSWNLNERAIAAEPLGVTHLYRRALKLWIFGRPSEADMVIDRVRQLWPKNPWAWNARLLIFAFTERPRAALAMLDDDQARPRNLTPAARSVWRASLAALAERTPATVADARQAILDAAGLSPGLAAYGVMILAGIGETDAAFQVANGFLLSRGSIVMRQQTGSRRLLVNDPNWRRTQWLFTPPAAPLRADPRFGPLCDGIGLTEYWRKRNVQPDYRRTEG